MLVLLDHDGTAFSFMVRGTSDMPKTLVLFSTSYHDWAAAADHKTRIQEVVGSIPAECWAFYFFFPFLRSLV